MTEDLQLPGSSNTATTHNPLGHLETVHNGTDCRPTVGIRKYSKYSEHLEELKRLQRSHQMAPSQAITLLSLEQQGQKPFLILTESYEQQ